MPRTSLLKSALDVRWWTPSTQLPPSCVLPIRIRSRLHQATTTPFQSTSPEIPPLSAPPPTAQPQKPPQFSLTKPTPQTSRQHSSAYPPPSTPPIAPKHTLPLPPPPKTTPLNIPPTYAHLTSQPPFYITAHIHSRPYLLTVGDTLRLPFHMPLVLPGDVLRLNCASVLGSREYTLKGAPYIDERLFICRVRVMGVESEPLRIKEKTKRRQRRVKKARSKHRYTILRVMEVRGRSEGELEVLQREASTGDGGLLEDGQS
jgi:large subunit ribosomal protein L21